MGDTGRIPKEVQKRISKLEMRCLQLEEALKSEQEKRKIYEEIFNHTKWGIVVESRDAKLSMMNSLYAEMHGYTLEEIEGRPIVDLYAPGFKQDVPRTIEIIHKMGHYVYRSQHIKKDGTVFPVQVDASVVCDGEGEILYRIVNIWDITNQVLMEEELSTYRDHLEELVLQGTQELRHKNKLLTQEIKKKEEAEKGLIEANLKITGIVQSITTGFFALNNNWQITSINTVAEKFLAPADTKTIIGKNIWDVLLKNPVFYDNYHRAVADQKPVHFEAFSVYSNRWAEVHAYPSSDGLSVFFRDISERKSIEDTLTQEREKFFTILDGLPGLVFLQGPNHDIQFANHKFKELYGEVIHRPCYTVMYGRKEPCEVCPTASVFATNIPLIYEHNFSGRIFEFHEHPFTDSNGLRLVVKIGLDITDKKRAEQEMIKLDRLNIIGELAAGIAHEVRNPMTTVRGFLQILSHKDTYSSDKGYFKLMIDELDRANSIITEFLSVARSQKIEVKQIDINILIEALYPLLMADALREDKQIFSYLQAVAAIPMNEGEIRQLILNLAKNGLEAMPPGGTLTIRTIMEGSKVVLIVQDCGKGIDQSIIDKLGTPFLTTKQNGTGLGLAICYGIVARHNGTIDFKTGPGGTTFTVRFAT
ncbi:MAG: PAS domain S-box protein [Desulfitobacteriaceae bacterium]